MSRPNSNDKQCQSKNVQEFFDNEMDASTHALMRAHIAECAVCAAELKALEHLHSLMRLALGFTSDLTGTLQRYSLSSH